MKAGYNLLLFQVCLTIAANWLYWSGILPVSRQLYSSPADIIATFNYNTLVSMAIGGIGGGLIWFLTRQTGYVFGALLIWVMSVLVTPLGWAVRGMSVFADVVLPSELWYVKSGIDAIVYFLFFMFIIEIASQRQIT